MNVLLVCLVIAVVVLVGGLIAVNASANGKAMNRAVQVFCDTVNDRFPLSEVDCGEYRKMTLFGIMKFNVKQYEARGVGNLSVMTTNMGLMQMATVVLTPTERDMPLVSMDYMYMLKNRTAYLEFYDLVLAQDAGYGALMQELGAIRKQYDKLETVTPSPAWYDTLKTEGFYKKGSKAEDDVLIDMLEKGLSVVMAYGRTLPELDTEAHANKVALQKTYSAGLIENGGISTDIFVKALGAEDTRAFFDRVLFKAD